MKSEIIPADILPYVTEISERLWTGHASVMVGAGFSKNAIAKDSSTKPLPSWYELGDIFYEKIHGEKPVKGISYLNPLRLAEEVQAAFGRPVLNQLLKNAIVDKDFDVSSLHINLMELPWSDVFTTNYDTLLERTCEHVVSRRFDVVVNQEDIIYSKRPRIIKLHGSFPSERPLIITDEDYRTYPKKFAPFVNTVQQSLLENTLCLIGFSGEDPNFLQWIGWINDNIGKENSPKIYLIGVLRLTDAQRKLLASKNIVPVDLTHWKGAEGNHSKALGSFLDFLHEQRKKRKNLDWPSNFMMTSSGAKRSVKEIVKEWSDIRVAYPNWVILPQEQRERLWEFTGNYSFDEKMFEGLDLEEDINYAFELNWRHERCLRPFFEHMVPHIRAIIDRYNPFGVSSELTDAISSDDPAYSYLDWDLLRIKWVGVCIGLLRFYREQGMDKDWESLENVLALSYYKFSPEQRASFFYERVLRAIFNADLVTARVHLKGWAANDSLPFWEAKRAALLSEFGEQEEAVKILEASLLTIRKRLNLSPVGDDYGAVSQEAYIMLLLRFVALSIRTSKREYSPDPTQAEFHERWIHHLQYRCDPWAEKKYFDLHLGKHRIKETFELDKVHSDQPYKGDARDTTIALSFFRFIEEVGMPLSINISMGSDTLQGALERVMRYSPSLAIGITNRLNDVKAINAILSRSFLYTFTSESSDFLLDFYLNKFEEFYANADECSLTSSFVRKVPAILSRLCVKSSLGMKTRLFQFAHQVYNSKADLQEFGKFVKNLLSCSSPELIYKMVPLMMDTPVLAAGLRDSSRLIDPFESLPTISGKAKSILKDAAIKNLYTLSKDKEFRECAVRRLVFLYINKLLSKSQSEKLAAAIWEFRDTDTGLPDATSFYKWYFMMLPQVKGVDARELYKKYIAENTFSVHSTSGKDGVSMGWGKDTYATELILGSYTLNNKNGVQWTAAELDVILDKCEQWLLLDSHFLTEEKYKRDGEMSIYNEFHLRFRNISSIISRVMGYQKTTLNNNAKRKIKKLINDLDRLNIPALKAKIMFSDEVSFDSAEYLGLLQEALASEERIVVLDGLESSIFSIVFDTYSDETRFTGDLMELLTQPLRWKIHGLMGDCMDAIREIVISKPEVYKSIEVALLNTLHYIKEIKIDHIPIWQNPNEFFVLRQKAIMLGKKLYNSYNGKGAVPQIIKDWENIAKDPNEFGDVTVYWDLEELG